MPNNIEKYIAFIASFGAATQLVSVSVRYYMNPARENKEIIQRELRNIKRTLRAYSAIQSNLDYLKLKEAINVVRSFLENPESLSKVQSISQQDKQCMLLLLTWLENNLQQIIELINFIHNQTIEEIIDDWPQLIELRSSIEDDVFNWPDKDRERASHLLLELDAHYRNSRVQENAKQDIVKTICREKQLDIKMPGLLIHNTKPHFWHPESIVKFIKRGILPSGTDITFGGHSVFGNMLSCYLTNDKMDREQIYEYDLAFIINPDFVQKNSREFYYNKHEQNENYLKLAQKIGFQPREMPHAWDSEIITEIAIPFKEIAGVVLTKPIIRNRLLFFMNKLAEAEPDLVFPVYDIEGKVIWPLL